MKKLMFASALVAGIALNGICLESANIVGYQKQDEAFGKSWIVNTFAEVGKDLDKVTLASIKPSEAFEFDADYIQFFNEKGGNAGMYTYIPEEPEEGYPAGWYDMEALDNDDEFVCANDKIVPYGTMIMFYATTGDMDAQFAGEVVQEPKTLAMPFGKSWVGNASPVDQKLLNFVPSEAFEFDADYIQFFNEKGGNAGMYTYIPEEPEEGYPAGWYDMEALDNNDEFVCANDKVVPAGTGFMFYATTGDMDITIPGAFEDKAE